MEIFLKMVSKIKIPTALCLLDFAFPNFLLKYKHIFMGIINCTSCGHHFGTYRNIKTLCCIPETSMSIIYPSPPPKNFPTDNSSPNNFTGEL